MSDIATNRDASYLLAHAQIEHENEPDEFDVTESTLETLVIGPHMTAEQIAQMCAAYSGPERRIVARIESIDGQPVVYLQSEVA